MEKSKILIVDDDPTKIMVLENILSEMDIAILTCNSGKEALSYILKEDFACILLDVNMPIMNGFETADLILKRKKSRLTPIIFITALNISESDAYKGYEIGAVDYLVTPIVPNLLKAKVKVFVDLYEKTLFLVQQAEELREANSKLTLSSKHINELNEKLTTFNEKLENQVQERAAKVIQNEKRFRKLIEQGHDIITLLDKDGKISFTSQNIESIFGYTQEEYIGTDALQYIHPDDFDSVKRLFDIIFRNPGETIKTEYRFLHKNGTYLWLNLTGTNYLDNPILEAIVTTSHDITERKQSEKLFLIQRDLGLQLNILTNATDVYSVSLETMLEVSGMDCGGIYLFDNDYRSLDLVFSKGCSDSFIQSVSHYDEDSENVKIVKKGEPVYIDYLNLPASFDENELSEKLMSLVIIPLLSENKVVGNINLGSYDFKEIPKFTRNGLDSLASQISNAILRIKSLEEIHNLNTNLELKIEERTKELAEAKKIAEQANLAKSEFLSRMSHELRTPLNSILGFAQLLNLSELNPLHNKGVNHILKSGKHLLDLINEVLDLSKIEAGHIRVSPEPIQVKGILIETIDIIRPLAEEYKIKVEVIYSPASELFVKSDRQRLKQILLNLINNAVKYNKVGGSVTIECSAIGVGTKESRVRISVIDTGKGIAAVDVGKLFNPFQRIGGEANNIEGTGLGLAVSKKLIEAMEGTIGVLSTLGVGSTFWIELPQTEYNIKEAKVISELLKSDTNTGDLAGLILYIEDNAINIELVEDIIATHYPKVRLISEMYGKNAIKKAMDYRPDLILLDLDLPDIKGGEVLNQLKDNANLSSIPVVVLSAEAKQMQVDSLMCAGASDYLTKPFDILQFLEVVEKIIRSGMSGAGF